MKTHAYPEPHTSGHDTRLNWLRASVLGANDGIVSIAGLVVGVAGATESSSVILTAGVAGIIAGAISMAAGEYVSVSSQRDSEKALLKKERWELKNFPEQELEELVAIYQEKGLKPSTARLVATELTKKDAFAAHVDVELGIDPNNLTNPWHAAFASAISFLVGAFLPLLAIIIPPAEIRIPVTFISVVVALAITGYVSARIGGARVFEAVVRVVLGGVVAMGVTYGIGKLLGVSGI
jgi:VIT1/CCC1 family predicted Fe2+/Mn2+ transporter